MARKCRRWCKFKFINFFLIVIFVFYWEGFRIWFNFSRADVAVEEGERGFKLVYAPAQSKKREKALKNKPETERE